jgi:hypothetical protein
VTPDRPARTKYRGRQASASRRQFGEGSTIETGQGRQPAGPSAALNRALEHRLLRPRPGFQGREVGVTPEILVAPAEQISRDRSLASQRDWPGAAASRLLRSAQRPDCFAPEAAAPPASRRVTAFARRSGSPTACACNGRGSLHRRVLFAADAVRRDSTCAARGLRRSASGVRRLRTAECAERDVSRPLGFVWVASPQAGGDAIDLSWSAGK